MEFRPFEKTLWYHAFRPPAERAFSDKLLSKEEVKKLQELIKKDNLTRQELLELLYLLTGVELKLANLTEYDRYLLGKYFAWVRDLVKLAEFLYDYIEKIEGNKFKKYGETIKETLEAIKKMILHDVKFGVDIYLFLLRSTLGIEAFAFDSLSKQRYEYEYAPYQPVEAQKPPERRSFFIFKR